MFKLKTWLAAVAMVALTSAAQASLITWQLSNVTLPNSGYISGSFAVDSNTGTLTTWNLTAYVSYPPPIPGGCPDGTCFYINTPVIFTPGSSTLASSTLTSFFLVFTPFSDYTLDLSFSDALTTPVPYPDVLLLTSGAAGPNTIYGPSILSGGASVVVSTVPEPETFAMMLAGLGLLGFAARCCKPNAAA